MLVGDEQQNNRQGRSSDRDVQVGGGRGSITATPLTAALQTRTAWSPRSSSRPRTAGHPPPPAAQTRGCAASTSTRWRPRGCWQHAFGWGHDAKLGILRERPMGGWHCYTPRHTTVVPMRPWLSPVLLIFVLLTLSPSARDGGRTGPGPEARLPRPGRGRRCGRVCGRPAGGWRAGGGVWPASQPHHHHVRLRLHFQAHCSGGGAAVC